LENGSKNQIVPKKLNNSNKFIDIISHNSYPFSVAVSKSPKDSSKVVCFECGKIGSEKFKYPHETNLENFIDYYAIKCNITLKMIHIKTNSKSNSIAFNTLQNAVDVI